MLYKCTEDFRTINKGDIVIVEIDTQVMITHDKHTTCTDEFILSMHFEKLEE